jgi:PAS domain S-box-containing protein
MENLLSKADIFISETMEITGVNKSDIESIFVSIFQASYDGIYVANKDGVGVMVNQAYTKMTGVNSSELLGKSMQTVVKEGIVSDSVTLKVLQEKTSKTIIQTVRGKELLVTGSPVFDNSGEIAFVVTNVRDISDLNQIKTELYQSKKLTAKYIHELEELKKRELIHMNLDGIIAQSQEIMKVFHIRNQSIRPCKKNAKIRAITGDEKRNQFLLRFNGHALTFFHFNLNI